MLVLTLTIKNTYLISSVCLMPKKVKLSKTWTSFHFGVLKLLKNTLYGVILLF